MSKKVELNVKNMLEGGAIAVGALADGKNHVMAILCDKKQFIIPIIAKKAYVGTTDDAEILDEIIQQINAKKIFGEANITGAKVFYSSAPKHEHVIKSFLSVKDLVQYEGINKVFEDAGYTIEKAVVAKVGGGKDYTELRKKDPFAEAIYQENKQELEAVRATYESLNLETKVAAEGLRFGDYVGIIFTGPTGTGKSWAGRIIADQMGAPYLTVQIDRGTTTDSLVGSFVPKAGVSVETETAEELVKIMRDASSFEKALEKASQFIQMRGEQAKWEFIPGPLLKGFIEGWVTIIEEANFGDPGVLAKLNEFTDKTLRVTINGISYKRNPNFVVIMTMNPGYEGTEILNIALKNRFTIVNVPQLTKDQFCARMIGYTEGHGHAFSKKFFEKLYDFARTYEKMGRDTQYHENVVYSIRNAQRFCDDILIKPRSLDEFSASIANNYLNQLTMDNDNSDKVEALKLEVTTRNSIIELFGLYDYAEIKTVKTLPALDAFFTIVDVDSSLETDDETLIDDKDLDKLMDEM